MARKQQEYMVRRVNSKEERRRPSVFIRLKTEEAFKLVALFEPDPEVEDNPGYFEYYDHYDKQGNTYVPCAGDRCPFCSANDNPSTRALTVWFDAEAQDAKDAIKVFTMNYKTIGEAADESEDEDGILGRLVRVKRLSDKGDYRVKIQTGVKKLSAAQLKKAMAALEEKIGEDGLPGLVERQLRAQMERLKALDALEDDDTEDDEEDEKPKARRGKPVTNSKAKAKEEDDEEDEEEEKKDEDEDETPEAIEDEDFEILKLNKRANSITIEHGEEEIVLTADKDDFDLSEFSKGDTVTLSAEWDEDEDEWVLSEIAEADGKSEDDEEDEEDEKEKDDDGDDTLSGNFEVVKIQEHDEIFDFKAEDGAKLKMWLGQGIDVDYDEIKKGVTVAVEAAQDDEGDWIITSIELAEQDEKPKRRTAARKR